MLHNKKCLSVFALTASLAAPQLANADLLGFRIGVDYWQQDISGDIRSGLAASDVDLENDLNLDSDKQPSIYIAFEHPVPFLPNILLQRVAYESENTATLSRSFIFDGNTYSINEPVKSAIDLNYLDLTAYYEVVDTSVSVDIGLTIRALEASASVESIGSKGESDVKGALPLLYGQVRFDIPSTDIYISGSLNWLSFDDSAMIETKLKAGYELAMGLAFELGYRSLELEHDDDDGDLAIDISIAGPFAGIQYKF